MTSTAPPANATAMPAYAAAAGVIVLWTGFILVSRAGATSCLTAWDIIAIRYAVAAPLLLILWGVYRRQSLLGVRHLLLAGIGGLGYALMAFAGFASAPAAHAGVLLPGAMPFLAAAWGWALGGQRPARASWPGYAAILAGVGCMAWSLGGMRTVMWGDACFLAAAALWTLFAALLRRWNADPITAITAVACWTAVVFLPIWWLFLPSRLAAAPWSGIALQAGYQGVLASVVQMLLFAAAIRRIGPQRMGSLMALVPVGAAILAVPILGEPLSAPTLAALILVGSGAVLVNRSTHGHDARRSATPTPAPNLPAPTTP